MNEKDQLFRIALSIIPGVGSILARNLVEYIGSVEGIFSQSYRSLLKIPGIGEVNARKIKNPKIFEKAEKELRFIEKFGISVYFYTDDSYPRRLKNCVDAPVILYAKGKMDLDARHVVSIVGTRNASGYGKSVCEKLIRDFSERNIPLLVVSGLAYGIDVHAHKTALKCSLPTVGVLGHGLDRIYPSLHAEIARNMLDNGGLVSDFPSGTKIDPPNFIRRNRIIAGLADATIVIESAEKGGSLITADIASSYNRDVFAFPGRTDDIYSRGCNRLIRLNGASLIQDIDDLIYFMGWDQSNGRKEKMEPRLFTALTPEEQKIAGVLKGGEALYIDQISARMKMTPGKIASLLLNLEFRDVLEALPGKMYRLKSF